MAGPPDVASVMTGMTSDLESTRKLTIYHLQHLVADASFADAFVQAGGVTVLKRTVLEESGNALAYALGCLTRLLEMDLGWEVIGADLIEHAVQLVLQRPAINVLRNALFLLVLVVSRPLDQAELAQSPTLGSTNSFGFNGILPILHMHEDFLDRLVEKLGSADHALCANALHLINALMRDSLVNGEEDEWPQFISRLQELGVIGGVEALMRGDAVLDLAGPLLDFQGLTKVLLTRWKSIGVDGQRPEHLDALQQIHVSSFPSDNTEPDDSSKSDDPLLNGAEAEHLLGKWRRLGFQTGIPYQEFADTGLLGLMDLTEYVKKNLDVFQNALLEQSVMPPEHRCPIARASVTITTLLFEYFDVATIDSEDLSLDAPAEVKKRELERLMKPLLLRWERLHGASLDAFMKLWKEAGAALKDYQKIEDLARLLIGKVLDESDRRGTIQHVQQELKSATLETVRQWQLKELEEMYNYAWGSDFRELRDGVHEDALQFLKEQRVRCLLKGAWFPVISATANGSSHTTSASDSTIPTVSSWNFVRLSHDRAYLHYALHPTKLDRDLPFHDMPSKIDLNTISSVDSSVSRSAFPADTASQLQKSSPDLANKEAAFSGTVTSLVIYGSQAGSNEEKVLLRLNTGSSSLASEWLDGLLMLLDQQPITADTNKLIDVLENWSLKVRMFNLRWEDVDWQRLETGEEKMLPERPVDHDYWYDMGE